MSKTVQMSSTQPVVVGASRHTVGSAALVQGIYGHRGNLELVARDHADGLWVFWFNADQPGDPDPDPAVAAGQWSAGLRFARGIRYTDAALFQGLLGPNDLEVLALDDTGTLQSWYWSPELAFVRRVEDAGTGAAAFRAAQHADGSLVIESTAHDGTIRMLSAGPGEYPRRTWAPADGSATDPLARERLFGTPPVSPEDQLHAADVHDIRPGTARSASSTRNGGSSELTWRGTDGALRHLSLPSARE